MLNFFDDVVLTVVLQDGNVIDIQRISYQQFAPDIFIQQFNLFSNLPPRLHRFLHLGEMRFREEIKNAFQMGQIVIVNKSTWSLLWEEYKIDLLIEDMSLKHALN